MGNPLCIPITTLRDSLIKELHAGGLFAHLGRDKIVELVEERYFLPHLGRDVTKFIQRCSICQRGKGGIQNTRFYTPLSVPITV